MTFRDCTHNFPCHPIGAASWKYCHTVRKALPITDNCWLLNHEKHPLLENKKGHMIATIGAHGITTPWHTKEPFNLLGA